MFSSPAQCCPVFLRRMSNNDDFSTLEANDGRRMKSERQRRTKMRITKVLLAYTAFFHRLSFVFGLATFYYDERRKEFSKSRTLNRYNKFMTATFFVCFPITMFMITTESSADFYVNNNATKITMVLIGVSQWILSTAILYKSSNEKDENVQVGNVLMKLLFNEDLSREYPAHHLHCLLKTTLMLVAFTTLNLVKNFGYVSTNSHGMLFNTWSMLMASLPSIIIILNSHRRLLATNLCWFLAIRHNDKILVEQRHNLSVESESSFPYLNPVDICTMQRTSLLFEQIIASQHANWKLVMINIGFSTLNIIIEVSHLI